MQKMRKDGIMPTAKELNVLQKMLDYRYKSRARQGKKADGKIKGNISKKYDKRRKVNADGL
jgi:hypothetical protein